MTSKPFNEQYAEKVHYKLAGSKNVLCHTSQMGAETTDASIKVTCNSCRKRLDRSLKKIENLLDDDIQPPPPSKKVKKERIRATAPAPN